MYCSNQRRPVAYIDAIPTPRAPEQILRAIPETLAHIERQTMATKETAKEVIMITIGGKHIAASIASPRAVANVPQKMALISEPSRLVRWRLLLTANVVM